MSLDNGKTFTVKAPEVSSQNRYVKAVKLNGQPYSKRYITRDDILSGGTLEFEMTDVPREKAAPSESDLPYSLSLEK